VFEADGDADHLIGHAHFLAEFGRDHGVRGDDGDGDERIDSAEAGGEGKKIERLSDAAGIGSGAFDTTE